MITRTQAAKYLAATIIANGDRQKAVQQVASWLYQTGKVRQLPYLMQDVSYALSRKGYVFATITTAYPVAGDAKAQIEKYIKRLSGAKNVECDYFIDRQIIGGVVIETPVGTFDASVRHKLAKFVEGVSR